MTAGRGIVHSEMPVVTSGDLHGFQLWINLPKRLKMQKPRYQDYQADSIQTIDDKDAKVRVISGNYKGISGPVVIQNPSMLLDVTVKPGGTFTQQIAEDWSGFAYIIDGAGKLGGTKGSREQALVLGKGDEIIASTDDAEGFRFLLIAGQPIKEPIVQHGPFVMNTKDEIYQAFEDYQSGHLQNPNDDVWAA